MCSIVILALLALCVRTYALPSSSGDENPIVYGLIRPDPPCYGLNITSPLDTYPPSRAYLIGIDTVRIMWKITSDSFVPAKITNIQLRYYGEGQVIETVWSPNSSAYGVVTYTMGTPYTTSTFTWTKWDSSMTTTVSEEETWTQEWNSWTTQDTESTATSSWSDNSQEQAEPLPTSLDANGPGLTKRWSKSGDIPGKDNWSRNETSNYENNRWNENSNANNGNKNNTSNNENNSWNRNNTSNDENNSWNSNNTWSRWNTTSTAGSGNWNNSSSARGNNTATRSWNSTTTVGTGYSNSTSSGGNLPTIAFFALDFPLTYNTNWPTESGEYYFQLNTLTKDNMNCWYTTSIIQIEFDM